MSQRTSTHVIEFPYARTLGPAMGPFMTGLREGRILGVRTADGRVLCPPLEWDPETGIAIDLDFVEVGPGGVVETWGWVTQPTPKHPLDHPFAFALIKLDGADTAIVHAVDAGSIDDVATGMRVTPRWKAERVGRIDDIEAFVPEEGRVSDAAAEVAGDEPVKMMDYFMHLEYHEQVAPNYQRFADALGDGHLTGSKCPACGLVYIPPRDFCPIDVVPMTRDDEMILADTGTVTNYTVVTPVQYYGQEETEPFVRASILLDDPGGSLMLQDILDLPADEVRAGLRVQAVWASEEERRAVEIDNRSGRSAGGAITGFRPTGEPDVPEGEFQAEAF